MTENEILEEALNTQKKTIESLNRSEQSIDISCNIADMTLEELHSQNNQTSHIIDDVDNFRSKLDETRSLQKEMHFYSGNLLSIFPNPSHLFNSNSFFDSKKKKPKSDTINKQNINKKYSSVLEKEQKSETKLDTSTSHSNEYYRKAKPNKKYSRVDGRSKLQENDRLIDNKLDNIFHKITELGDIADAMNSEMKTAVIQADTLGEKLNKANAACDEIRETSVRQLRNI